MPILAFAAALPADGLPMLTDWMGTAQSIWGVKFEDWREPFEVKPSIGSVSPGDPLSFGSLEVVKGCGRMSVLLFSLFYSYLHLKTRLDPEELAAFKE